MQRTLLTLVVAAFFAVAVAPVSAQTPTSPKPLSPGFDLSGMYAHIVESMLDQLATPDTATKLARFQKQHYDALIKEGFSHDDAIRLVAATGIPFMSAGK